MPLDQRVARRTHSPAVMGLADIRLRELVRLEMCERALADAYRLGQAAGVLSDTAAQELALHHFEHAGALRGRILALGGRPRRGTDRSWLLGEGPDGVRRAERISARVYHDHLQEMDSATLRVIRDDVVPDHTRALELLDPGFVAGRDGVL